MYKGFSIRLTANFSSESMEDWKQWMGIFKVLGKKDALKMSMKDVLSSKLSFKYEGEINTFPG